MKRYALSMSWVIVTACTSAGPSNPTPGAPDAAPGGGAADARPTIDLPFVVDDWYAASGYMGDGEQPGAIADDSTCTRAGDARGMCHRFTWDPGSLGWGGVYWQHPPGNWGEQPGLALPPGATGVSFYAWGEQGGEVVSFMVGMGDADGFEVKQDAVTLTAAPTRYTLSLSNTGYGAVVGGFGWVAADSEATVVFHVDDIVWE